MNNDQLNRMIVRLGPVTTLIYRAIILLGFGAIFWLRGTFVSKEDMDKMRGSVAADMEKMRGTVTAEIDGVRNQVSSGRREIQNLTNRFDVFIEANKVNARQDDLLRDHELRIRTLEARR